MIVQVVGQGILPFGAKRKIRSWWGHPQQVLWEIPKASQKSRSGSDLLKLALPGAVKAVQCLLSWQSIFCQNPAVRSKVKKIELPAHPMSLMHSLASFMKYLSMWLLALRAQKA